MLYQGVFHPIPRTKCLTTGSQPHCSHFHFCGPLLVLTTNWRSQWNYQTLRCEGGGGRHRRNVHHFYCSPANYCWKFTSILCIQLQCFSCNNCTWSILWTTRSADTSRWLVYQSCVLLSSWASPVWNWLDGARWLILNCLKWNFITMLGIVGTFWIM